MLSPIRKNSNHREYRRRDNRSGFTLVATACVLAAMYTATGCHRSGDAPRTTSTNSGAGDVQTREDLFDSAVETLMRIEELCNLNKYNPPPIGARDQINRRLTAWVDTRDPPIAWEPTPNETASRQMIERLNRWSPTHIDEIAWQAPSVTDELPSQLQSLANAASLAHPLFTPADARFLELSVWLRDISDRAAAGQTDDLERAEALFDWTVRNIQLVDDAAETPAWHLPWQTLLLGRGTKTARAWVFILLARQQGLPVVMLARADEKEADESDGAPVDWLPALLAEGQLYLFDTWLGLPIPGPGDQEVATLDDVIEDASLLENLDLTQRRPYPVKSADLSHVVAYYEASPQCLSRRMALLESRLAADAKLVLTIRPNELVQRLNDCRHVAEVRSWPHPYLAIQRAMTADRDARQQAVEDLVPLMTPPMLWRGRLRHLRGRFEGERNAVTDYLEARTPDNQLERLRVEDAVRDLLVESKQLATYWLGLLSYELGNYDAAISYLDRLTLEKWPEGPWTDGARYNLARTYEAMGDWQRAVELYETDITTQLHGNRLRGKRLEAAHTGESNEP